MRWQHFGIVLASALLMACTGELVVDPDPGGGGGGGGGADAGTGGGGADSGGGGGSAARQFFDENVVPIMNGDCVLCHADPPLGASPEFLGDKSETAMYNGILNSGFVNLATPDQSTFLVEDAHDGGAAPGLVGGDRDAVVMWLEMEE